MSNAFKCDRCGKLFEKRRTEERDLYVVINPYNPNSAFDLCSNCHTELKNWWLTGEKESEE